MLRFILAVLLMGRYYGDPAVMGGSGAGGGGVTVTVDATTTLVTGAIAGPQGASSKDWHGRASIVTRGDGVKVLFWHDATSHTVNDGALHVKFSDDDGATWTATDTKLGGGAVSGFPMNPATLTAGEDAGEPWAIVAPSGDILLFMWRIDYGVTKHGTYMSRSTDGGETWSSPTTRLTFTHATATEDTQNRTFATDDGFVDPATNDIYIAGRIYTSTALTAANFCLFKSTDDGATWERVSLMASASEAGGKGIEEAGIELIGASTIIAMLRDFPEHASYQRVSTDMGLTWGPLIDVTSTVGIAGRQRVYTVDHLMGNASWWLDDRLLMTGYVSQTYGASFPRRNAVWVSLDAGTTWSTPFYIDTNGASTDGGYADITYKGTPGSFMVVSYKGPDISSADLIQYDLTIGGL